MNLQARLTLYYVLLAVVMVGVISAVDLAHDVELQFDLTLERAESLRALTTDMVELTLNRQRTKPLEEVVRDPDLAVMLADTMLASQAILEIAVVSPQGVILADSVPDHEGERLPPYADLRPVVSGTNWYQKLWRLGDTHYYQLEQALGPRDGPPLVYVRVIVDPTLIRANMLPRLVESALAAGLSVGGAVVLTLLFSAFAFRPVGRLKKQLDLLASGEYEETPAAAKPARDDFSIMASKVSLLGERLRGAQFEVSDLRGNIDRLLQDLEDAVFLFNREGLLVFASGSVEKLLGQKRAELAGQTMESVFPPTTKAGLLIAQAAETGRAVRNRRAEARGRGSVAVGGCAGTGAGRRPVRGAGAAARSGGTAADWAPTAYGGPAGGAEPGVGRGGARSEEPAQRHPAARGGGAGQGGAGRYGDRAADGHHLARDSAAGPRGQNISGFHAAGGAETDARFPSIGCWARWRIWRGPRPRRSRFEWWWRRKATAAECGRIAICSSRPS